MLSHCRVHVSLGQVMTISSAYPLYFAFNCIIPLHISRWLGIPHSLLHLPVWWDPTDLDLSWIRDHVTRKKGMWVRWQRVEGKKEKKRDLGDTVFDVGWWVIIATRIATLVETEFSWALTFSGKGLPHKRGTLIRERIAFTAERGFANNKYPKMFVKVSANFIHIYFGKVTM